MSHRSCPWCASMAFSIYARCVNTAICWTKENLYRLQQMILAKTNTGGAALRKIKTVSNICPYCSVPYNKCRWGVLYLKERAKLPIVCIKFSEDTWKLCVRNWPNFYLPPLPQLLNVFHKTSEVIWTVFIILLFRAGRYG